MTFKGPIPCRSNICEGRFAYLLGKLNPKTGKYSAVPVDWDSISEVDRVSYLAGISLSFNRSIGHRSHYETCAEPGRFTRRKKDVDKSSPPR